MWLPASLADMVVAHPAVIPFTPPQSCEAASEDTVKNTRGWYLSSLAMGRSSGSSQRNLEGIPLGRVSWIFFFND